MGRAGQHTGRATAAKLDAIVVPASRPAANLDHAVTLARAAHCRLIVLCSRDARASDVAELLAARRFGAALAADLPVEFSHPLLSFKTSTLARAENANPNGDLSTKRNLGLMLARMVGWTRIFFMDDDIRDLDAADLRAASSMLKRYRSVGMRVTDFPDNSVVCHAHRETGGEQDVFVSGSVLAVDCRETFSFFPDIYNEDWLFFYDSARDQQLGWSGRNATQLHYDPFRNVQRARRQEFGDTLAEGLYALLESGSGYEEATSDYWTKFRAARQEFLQGIVSRSTSVQPENREKMITSVQAAIDCLTNIQPWVLADYVRTWREDLGAWREGLRDLSPAPSPEAALVELGLIRTASAEASSHASRSYRQENTPPGRVHLPRSPTLQPLSGAGPVNAHRRDALRVNVMARLATVTALLVTWTGLNWLDRTKRGWKWPPPRSGSQTAPQRDSES
jgi:hypothetical protein